MAVLVTAYIVLRQRYLEKFKHNISTQGEAE